MRSTGHQAVWRALALACGLIWLGPAAELKAFTLQSSGLPALTGGSSEPFGLPASILSSGGLQRKWLELERKLDDDRVQLALCDGDRDRCVSAAALKLLAIVDEARAREGRARFGVINRAVNLAIRPMSDLAQYGAIDVWSPPLDTFASGAGDCEDYAIAKFVALQQAGVPTDDLRIVILRETLLEQDHAVVAARLDSQWLILDNRRMAMVEDLNLRNDRPLFVIDDSGVMKYPEVPLTVNPPAPPSIGATGYF